MGFHGRAGAWSLFALLLLSVGCDGDTPSAALFKHPPVSAALPLEGELYPDFADAGVALSDPSVGDGQPLDVLAVGSWIYVGGSFRNFASGDTTGRWKIEKRRASTGALVQNFGGGAAPLGTITRLATDQQSLYAAGIELLGIDPSGLPNFAWRVEKRRLGTGALVRAFGDRGVLALDISPFSDLCRDILVDGPDLYLIGEDSSFQDPSTPLRLQWRIEKRSASTGALDPDFGTGGVVTYYQDPGPGGAFDAEPRNAVLVGGSLVVAGAENGRWRIEKRDKATGDLDPTFGAGGVVTRDPGFNFDEARRIVTDGIFLYVAGTEEFIDGRAWRIEKFDAATGDSDASFGTGGVVLPLPMGVNTEPRAMVEIEGVLYVGGMHSLMVDILDTHWTVLKMQAVDGTLVGSFGAGGILDLNPTAGIDAVGGLAASGPALYIVGSQQESQWRIEKRAR